MPRAFLPPPTRFAPWGGGLLRGLMNMVQVVGTVAMKNITINGRRDDHGKRM